MHGAFRTDVLVDLSNTAWADIPPHRSNAHTHVDKVSQEAFHGESIPCNYEAQFLGSPQL